MITNSSADTGDLAVLRTLALRGFVENPSDDNLAALQEQGLIVYTKAGFMLTAEGRERHTELLAAADAESDIDGLRALYERFLPINREFKGRASRWQNASEDERFVLLGEIAEHVDRVRAVLARMTELLPRFAGYSGRLGYARNRAEEGELDYVVSPRVESVHTIWMELHEDLLQTLGISREEEDSY